MSTTVYQYNLNGEYVGETVAYGGLLPANTTAVAPILQAEHWPVWQNGVWVNVADNRQTPYWLPSDTYQTPARHVTALGPLPEGALLKKIAPTLEEAQQAQLNTINAQYDAIVAMAKTNVPDGEVLTWDIQKSEAEAWAADNSAETPFIDGIAQGRGMDRVVLIEKVLVKTAAYRDFVAIKTGIRQRLEDAIFAAETVEAVRAIVWPADDGE